MPNQPPKELTTPPEGYEWTGEVRQPEHGDDYTVWGFRGWVALTWRTSEVSYRTHPILRRILSPTVTVELSRNAANYIAATWPSRFGLYDAPWMSDVGQACEAALEAEKNGESK